MSLRRIVGLSLLFLLAPPAVAQAATLTAHSFTQRHGRVAELAGGGGRQGRVLALHDRASVKARIVGVSFDRISARLLEAAIAGTDGPVAAVCHQPDCSEIALELTGHDPGFPPGGVAELSVDV